MSGHRWHGFGVCMALGATLAGLTFGACGGDAKESASPSPTRRATPTRDADASPTELPATTDIGMELDEWVIRPNQTRARPGTINFQLSNAGDVEHEFVVIKSDEPIAELPRLPGERGVDEGDLDVVGRVEGPVQPGDEGELSVELDEGKYVLICNLAPNGESHYLNGMYTAFEVRTDVPLATTTPTPTP